MRTIVIEGLERVGPAQTEGAHWFVHGYVKGKPEVRVTVELRDGEGKWRGSNVIGQLMDGDTQEVEVDLQQRTVWISIQGAESTNPPRYLSSRKS